MRRWREISRLETLQLNANISLYLCRKRASALNYTRARVQTRMSSRMSSQRWNRKEDSPGYGKKETPRLKKCPGSGQFRAFSLFSL